MSREDYEWRRETRLEGEIERLRAEVEALRDALRTVRPALREVLWCALCWNDHNFSYAQLYKHAEAAAKALGLYRMNGVDKANELMAHIDAALEEPK